MPVLNALPFGVCAVDEHATVLALNQEGGRLLGWHPRECQGRHVHDVMECRLAQPLERHTCPVAAMLHSGNAVPLLPGWVRDRYDRTLPVECGITAYPEDVPALYLLSFHDIRGQLSRDEALLQLARMPEEAPAPIVELNEDGTLLYANPVMAGLLCQHGYRPDAFPLLLPPDIPSIVRQVLTSGTPTAAIEVAIPGAWYSWTFCPIVGTPRVRGYGTDLTAVRLAEAEADELLRKLELNNRALDEACRTAQAAMDAKGRLLATMTHELRTPVVGMTGMAGFLLETALSPEQRQYAEAIQQSAEALLALISDVLDVSRAEAGKLRLEQQDFDMIAVVEGVTELLAEEAARKGVELAAVIAPDVPTALRGDPGRLRQVLINLTGNAVKFCNAGEVVITVERAARADQGAMIRFSISDTGEGIPIEYQDRVFDAFERVERHPGTPGSGLGLHISKHLVELMGGHIGIESHPGCGSRFWFTVRMEASLTMAAAPPPEALRGVRVLIIEDHAATRTSLQQQFMAWEVDCDEASSGEAAVSLLQEAQSMGRGYAATLIDLTLPDMSGLDVVDMIHQHTDAVAGHLVLMTAFGGRVHEDVAHASGIAAQLMKPMRRSHLRHALAAILRDPERPGPQDAEVIAPLRSPLGLRVLLVEDHAVNQAVALKMLKTLGCRCDLATDGHEAVLACQRTGYDVVLMDCALPIMDGYEATRRIRETERVQMLADAHLLECLERDDHDSPTMRLAGRPYRDRLPIIAVTANVSEGHLERCFGAGMDDFLPKPLTAEGLDLCLRRWCAPPGETPYDRAAALARLDGSEERLSALTERFMHHAPHMVDEIETAVRSKDTESLLRAAQALQSAAARLCAPELMAAAHVLFTMGRSGRLEGAESACGELRRTMAILMTLLLEQQ
jgi:signal transduction histidine kinase/DNA-binding response OmpR family regulator